MERPDTTDYVPAIKNYITLVPDGEFLELLIRNKDEVTNFFSSLPPGTDELRYSPGKWTIKQMVQHFTDAERVFAYRALTLARGDKEIIFPSMNENLFAENADVTTRSLADILQEFFAVRDASLFLFKNLSAQQLQTQGKLFGHPVTPLGIGYLLIGHTLHHIKIVRERYLSKP